MTDSEITALPMQQKRRKDRQIFGDEGGCDMKDSELTALLRQSEQNGHAALFREYGGYVYAIVYGRLRGAGSREDAEECVSDVFAEVFRSYDSDSRHDGDLKGFIAAVAKRRAIDAYRRLSGKPEQAALDTIGDVASGEDVAETAEEAEQRRVLLECIEALGEPDAAIIIQKFYYRRNSREIAKALHMKPSAVRMRCSRALKTLKKKLTEIGFEE